MKTIAALEARLGELHQRTRETPLFNPVFQLSLDLSRALEGDELTLDDLSALVAELECDGLKARAGKLRSLLAPSPQPFPLAGEGEDFEAFRARWERPQLHAVFTAHPTFLLAPAQAEAVAAAASGDDDAAACAVPSTRTAVTLDHEHRAAMDAMARAQDARDVIVARLLEEARSRWPQDWRALRPMPFRFASWVGYDMDGRTDIGWHTSIAFRLAEKAERLARYTASLDGIDPAHPLLETLRPAAAFAAARAEDFAADLSSAEALAAAANRLTTHSTDNLLSLTPLIAALEAEAETADPTRAVRLLTLAAAMRADGLGMGWIHFRVNAKQLHNAIRRRLADDEAIDLASKGAIATLRRMVDEARPLRTNFAALATESSTAIRQFLAMAQILKHIDADAPIRMLVAECEQPATVLAALYFAKLFGVEDKVDVSPLFETETALEHGGRFLDALLAEPAYRAYARQRGRVAVQTGFSDAGRFVGQIPASPRHRTPARPPCRGDGRQRAVRHRRAGVQHPRRKHGPRRASCQLSATGSNGRSPPGHGGGLRGRASGWSPRSAFRAATATCSSPRPNWRSPPSPASPNCARPKPTSPRPPTRSTTAPISASISTAR